MSVQLPKLPNFAATKYIKNKPYEKNCTHFRASCRPY